MKCAVLARIVLGGGFGYLLLIVWAVSSLGSNCGSRSAPACGFADAGACGAGMTRVCLNRCVPLRGVGDKCDLDPCKAEPAQGVCGLGSRCVTNAAGSTSGTCQPANTLRCTPGPMANCSDLTYCTFLRESAGGETCTVEAGSDPSQLAGRCRRGQSEGQSCDGDIAQAVQEGGLCRACESGLHCIEGLCRRSCASHAECPCEQRCGGGRCRACVRSEGVCDAEHPCCDSATACSQGRCVAVGSSCTVPDQPCQIGVIAMQDGVAVCTSSGVRSAGTSCGTGGEHRVCNQVGACLACAQGQRCGDNPCQRSVINCASGAAVCTDQFFELAGTPCNNATVARGVCDGGGLCIACDNGSTCVHSNGCAIGRTSCAMGRADCVMMSTRPAGTACAAADGSPGVCDGFTTCEVGSLPCDTEGATIACYTGPPGSSGVAHCAPGVRTCERAEDGSLRYSACRGQQLPRVEECNAVDDDCSGAVDDHIPDGRLSDFLQGALPPGQPPPRHPMGALCRLFSSSIGDLPAPHDNTAFIEVGRVVMPSMPDCLMTLSPGRSGVFACRNGSFVCESELWWDFCTTGTYDTVEQASRHGSRSEVRRMADMAAQSAGDPAGADAVRGTTCGLGVQARCNPNCYTQSSVECQSREVCGFHLTCIEQPQIDPNRPSRGECQFVRNSSGLEPVQACQAGQGRPIRACWTWSATGSNALSASSCAP